METSYKLPVSNAVFTCITVNTTRTEVSSCSSLL